MSSNYLDIIRPGINTTFQDKGRDHLYHIGIPFSGAMDNRNYLIANKLVNNNLDSAVIEFAYQGPYIKYSGERINFAVTGDVIFSIKKKDADIEGNCYQSYQVEDGDEINIVSTNKSVYGYLAFGGEFDLKFQWNSCSINTKANIGSNDGKKLDVGQRINLKKINSNKDIKKTNTVSKLSDRMGMRLEGPKIDNIVNTNIKSEGLIKGVIQVPADGNPIIMLSDHGTIGGYPKIGVVASVDYDRLVQMSPGSKIKFKEINLSDAETLFKLYEMETQNLLSQI